MLSINGVGRCQRVGAKRGNEAEGLRPSPGQARAEKRARPEAPAKEQPVTDPDREGRDEIARFLGRNAFPGTRETLVDAATRNNAPDRVVDAVTCLPTGQVFQNVHEVWVTLGGKGERKRT